jgi:hypothetical protein
MGVLLQNTHFILAYCAYCFCLAALFLLAAVVSFFTAGFRVLPTAAYCPPTELGAASAPVGVERCPFLNMYALRLFNVSDGFKFFFDFFPFTVVLTARVVTDELRVAVCADANMANPKSIKVSIIIRFIIIHLAYGWYKSGAKPFLGNEEKMITGFDAQ